MDLAISKLSAWYGEAQALWDVDVSVSSGEVVGVLGRNGAGKTTLLRSIAGLQPRIDGAIRFGNQQLAGQPTHRIALHGVYLVREGGRLPSSLTVVQNLALGQLLARRRGRSGRALTEIWRWFPMLEPLRDRRAGHLSGGQRQALALAVAFISTPEIMLLDEPSAGLSPPVAKALFATIRQLAESGVTVLAVEQNPAWLLGLASRGYLLEVGAIRKAGPLETLLEEARVEGI